MKALMIGYVWPELNASAAALRDWGLARAFQRAGWQVTYSSPAKENEFTAALRAEGIATHSIEANDPRFDALLAELQPDFVLFDRFVIEEQFGWRVEDLCPGALGVLDTQDLHFLRRARERGLRSGATLENELDASEDLLRELSSIYRSDLTLILSDFEMDLLRSRYGVPSALLELCRFSYPDPAPAPDFGARAGFVMIGNFRHPPNADAVAWLRHEIWPRIRARMPEATVHVYGAYPPREMTELHDPRNGFVLAGWADDAATVLRRHRVNLAPLRFGAGIKGKITDGWWAGAPAVTTAIGAEGMCARLPFGGLVVDPADPGALADAAVRLYSDAKLWNDSVAKGHEILSSLYSERVHDERLIAAITGAFAERAARRQANFTGRMLRHHLHRSTKFFSRWIEAKLGRTSPLQETQQRDPERDAHAP